MVNEQNLSEELVGVHSGEKYVSYPSAEEGWKQGARYLLRFSRKLNVESGIPEIELLRSRSGGDVVSNGWIVKGFKKSDYFGRLKLVMVVVDPTGREVEIESGGFSDHIFLQMIHVVVARMLAYYEALSCFASVEARRQYFSRFKEKDNREQPYIGLATPEPWP